MNISYAVYIDLNMDNIREAVDTLETSMILFPIKIPEISLLIFVTAFPDMKNPDFVLQPFMIFSFIQNIHEMFDVSKWLKFQNFIKDRMKDTDCLLCVTLSSEKLKAVILVLNMTEKLV